MKKILLLTLSLLLIVSMALGFSSCKKKKNKNQTVEETKTYTIDTASFNSVAAFGENLSLNGLNLVEQGGEVVKVTGDMVSGIDTSTVGAKSFTVNYNGQSFTVNYAVKYRVTFVIEGVETNQYVLDASEIVLPDAPAVPGKQFDKWLPAIPNVLTGNLRIDAVYTQLSNEQEDVYTWTGNGLINLEGYVASGTTPTVTLTDLDGNPLDSSIASVDTGANKIGYSLSGNNGVILAISGSDVMSKSWKISLIDEPTLSTVGGKNVIGVTLGGELGSQKITYDSSLISFKYSTGLSNTNANAYEYGGYVFVEALKLGVTDLTITAVNATNELESIILNQKIVVMPATEEFIISNAATEYGIENMWTVGKHNAAGLTKFRLLSISADKIGSGFYENLSFVTDNTNVTVGADGTLSLLADTGADIVRVSAVFGLEDAVLASAPMQIRCVYDGYNVYSYNELWEETSKANPRPIVLQSNIKDDFSATNYTQMKSTYDLTYLQNVGAPESRMMIKVLIQFKNDVYGNGYEINAHNATLGTYDSTGSLTAASIFRGPIPFIAVSDTAGGSISYNMQDNIAFAVHENVTVNNIILKSCELAAKDGKVDLTDLTYVGTTVEVLGDNVTIEYSRLMYGRTILRVFGDDNDSSQEIHTTVKNTIIKGSREFSARIGSNRFYHVDGVRDPNLPGDNGTDYNTKKTYDTLSPEERAAYDDKYINTYVTFRNVVFEDAGISPIGLDAHFSGALLDGDKMSYGDLLKGWEGLAKTSYGAKVTFESDVRMYTWRPVADIDSSTFIDSNIPTGSTLPNLTFDVKSILYETSKKAGYQNILSNYGGQDCINLCVIFFGGGKNYSVLENKIASENRLSEFNTYQITFGDMGTSNLEFAAGSQPFYFLGYDATSSFTYADQLAETDKYSFLRNGK